MASNSVINKNEGYYSSMIYVKIRIVMSSAAQVMYAFGRCMCFTSICIGPCGHVELVSIPELSK